MRLTRMGGFASSNMSYAEEAILVSELKSLPETEKQRATAITGLDFEDQQRLHRYDLLPDIKNDMVNWQPLILDEFRDMIDKRVGY
jgi:hypothetical protein